MYTHAQATQYLGQTALGTKWVMRNYQFRSTAHLRAIEGRLPAAMMAHADEMTEA